MKILKVATDWAKAEIVSSYFFSLFGILFLLATLGFWQLGKTEVSKAFIYPMLFAGILLLLAGIGFFFSNKSRLSSFEADYNTNPSAFVKSEIARAEKTMSSYQNVAFKVFPAIIVLATLLVIFVDSSMWRAISITTIALMVVIIFLDYNAHARMKVYHQQLVTEEQQE